jgi:outer membrane protein assembly factor BamA
VNNLMRTQAFHSVHIQIDKNEQQEQQQQTQDQDQQSKYHSHILKVILDEKNWYSIYIGGGIKHEGIEDGSMMSSSTALPKAQFESSITLTNLTGYLDQTKVQYTIDQTSTSRLLFNYEKPLYSWFPEDSAISQSVLALLRGSQYSLGVRALIDTVDHESTRSYKEYQRLVQWKLDNSGNVTRPEMAPDTYWGVDWTLGLRDVVPRKDSNIPYAADASPEIVAQSGSSLLHTVKWEARTNGGWTDDRYQPTLGVDGYAQAEIAGPPGDVGYAKAQGGGALHYPLSNHVSLHAACSGGILRPLSFNGLCRSPTISDRFFVGGPFQLRGFLPAGIGPRSKTGGKMSPGGDAMGGNLFYTASVAASALPPNGVLADYGIRLFAFGNAGTLVGTHQQLSWMQIVQSTRTSVGFGISGGTPMGRVELTYAWPLRYGPRDARRNLQFGFGFSYG